MIRRSVGVHVQAVLAVDARALDSGVKLELAFHFADWLAVGGDFPGIRDVVGGRALLALVVQKADVFDKLFLLYVDFIPVHERVFPEDCEKRS
jgi:hypothetical protein